MKKYINLYTKAISAVIIIFTASLQVAFASTFTGSISTGALTSTTAGQLIGIVAPLIKSIPIRLTIASVKINAPIQAVGTNAKGEMAVPSGSTNNVGWYQYGPVPGQAGTAVLDAHVFAAFSNLKFIKPGTDITVVNAQKQKLHFVVTAVKTYALKDLTPSNLFGSLAISGTSATASYLNLITCAGQLTKDHSTYDHRLIVYTKLVNVKV